MAQSDDKLISIKTRRYAELLRRILITYRGVEILVDRKPHGDVDDLLKNWCTNANIRKTRDFEVLRDGKSLFGFHDGPSGFFWAATSEMPFVEQLSSERIVRYRILKQAAPRLPYWVVWIMVIVALMLTIGMLWVAGYVAGFAYRIPH